MYIVLLLLKVYNITKYLNATLFNIILINGNNDIHIYLKGNAEKEPYFVNSKNAPRVHGV